jgi:hypothetical protein
LIVKVDEDGMNQLAITPELIDEMVRFIKKKNHTQSGGEQTILRIERRRL